MQRYLHDNKKNVEQIQQHSDYAKIEMIKHGTWRPQLLVIVTAQLKSYHSFYRCPEK